MPNHAAGLNLMRAVAISLVLMHHLDDLVVAHADWTRQLWGTGPLGVDLFFALSGFLIGRILLQLGHRLGEPSGLVGFWGRRWLRTLPLYYLILAANIVSVIAREGHAREVIQVVQPYFYFGQSFFSRAPSFFNESWSLAVEEFFYLAFPLFWAGLIRLQVRPLSGYLTGAVLLLLIPVSLRLLLDPAVPRMWLYDVCTITLYRTDSIAVGVLAAALSLRYPAVWMRWRYPGLILGLFLLVLDWRILTHVRDKPAGFMLVGYFAISGLGCALVLPWCSLLKRLPWAWLDRWAGLVAGWSYALYLVHMLILTEVKIFLGPLLAESAAWSWLAVVLVLTASLLTAAGLHRWFEKPFMAWRERWPLTRQDRGQEH